MATTPDSRALAEQKRAKKQAAADDVLLREVDDAVRQDQYTDFGKRYGIPLLIALGLALAALAAYIFWDSRQEAAMEADSEALVRALDQVEAGNLDSGSSALADLAQNGEGGARAAALMLQAGIAAEQGNASQAADLFAQAAANDDAPPAMRDLANVREVALRYDTMQPGEVVSRLQSLAVPGNPYFGSAGEMVAMAYLDQGKRAEAGTLFAEIAKADDVPETLRSRARQMSGLLGVDAIEDVDALLEEQGVGADAPLPAAAQAQADRQAQPAN